ncbi:hypothetical protein Ancab_024964 [Ancistrocladus abbreviatus]
MKLVTKTNKKQEEEKDNVGRGGSEDDNYKHLDRAEKKGASEDKFEKDEKPEKASKEKSMKTESAGKAKTKETTSTKKSSSLPK